MEVIITLLIVFVVITGMLEIVSRIVYGKILKDEDVLEAINFHLPKGVSINQFNTDILTIGDMPYIAKTTRGVLAEYHISDVGRVSVFSKSHKLIKTLHNAALETYKKENPPKTIKQKLNIK